MTRLSVFALTSLLLTSALPASAAESVDGHFTLDTHAVKPTHVSAFRIRETFDPRSFQTYVMLTLQPVDRDAILGDTDPYAVAINDAAVRDADSISFFVAADGKTSLNAKVGGVQYVDSSGPIMGQRGSLLANCETNTATHVKCQIKVAEPVKTMDGPSWTMDLSFDTSVLSRPAGKKIPSDGGEPGKAFLALVEAAQSDDLARIVALLSADEASNFQHEYNTPEENLAEAKSTLEYRLPKKPSITGGEMFDEQRAVLEVEGVPYADGRALYLVEMVRTDKGWVFDAAGMAGILR